MAEARSLIRSLIMHERSKSSSSDRSVQEGLDFGFQFLYAIGDGATDFFPLHQDLFFLMGSVPVPVPGQIGQSDLQSLIC